MTTEKETAAALHAARGNSDEWGTEESNIVVAPRKNEVVSFRLPSDELDQLERAAAEAGESISEYVRAALKLRITGAAVFAPDVDLMAGMGSFVWFAEPRASGRSSAESTEEVPDFPPLTVNM